MVDSLLNDLSIYCGKDSEVILTLNIPEVLSFGDRVWPFKLVVIRNSHPRGFAENHNAAFRSSAGAYFCVVNPDIRLIDSPFSALCITLSQPDVGVVGPLVLNCEHKIEDSARRFPDPIGIVFRKLRLNRGSDYEIQFEQIYPDWIAGMFMMFRREVFQDIRGFDERYFLYLEDVDLCARIRLAGKQVVLNPTAAVVHNAQRRSRRSIKYFKWHFSSMARFFLSRVYLVTQWRRVMQS